MAHAFLDPLGIKLVCPFLFLTFPTPAHGRQDEQCMLHKAHSITPYPGPANALLSPRSAGRNAIRPGWRDRNLGIEDLFGSGYKSGRIYRFVSALSAAFVA
jgi:hypothetical protein